MSQFNIKGDKVTYIQSFDIVMGTSMKHPKLKTPMEYIFTSQHQFVNTAIIHWNRTIMLDTPNSTCIDHYTSLCVLPLIKVNLNIFTDLHYMLYEEWTGVTHVWILWCLKFSPHGIHECSPSQEIVEYMPQ